MHIKVLNHFYVKKQILQSFAMMVHTFSIYTFYYVLESHKYVNILYLTMMTSIKLG